MPSNPYHYIVKRAETRGFYCQARTHSEGGYFIDAKGYTFGVRHADGVFILGLFKGIHNVEDPSIGWHSPSRVVYTAHEVCSVIEHTVAHIKTVREEYDQQTSSRYDLQHDMEINGYC